MDNLEKYKKLTTKRLLAYYKAERKRRKLYPYYPYELSLTKEQLKSWDEEIIKLKAMLDEREHVEKKEK